MEFSATTIILIVIFVLIGFVLVWAIKNGNNLKFKKKSKKKTDKFKDVVPKEKPAKEEKPKEIKEPIRKAVKDEKLGKAEAPTNKVVKVTKEDFKNSDLSVPKTLEEKTETKTQSSSKPKTQEKFNFDDFDLDKELEALGLGKPVGKPPMELDAKEFEDFLAPMSGAPVPSNPFMMSPAQDFKMNKDFEPIDFEDDFFKPKTPAKRTPGTIENKTIEERFNAVFGDSSVASSPQAKEVIIGDILSTNRSRTNRELRTKRTKFMK